MRPTLAHPRRIAVWLVLVTWLAACAPMPLEPLQAVEINTEPLVDREHSTQLQRGAHYYWLWCMACHGDRGQGLADEWRERYGEGNANCWQAKCHLMNQAGPTFVLPHIVPPVIGATTLARFQTAQDLHDYLFTTMPWWNPGQLTDEDSWDLTVYLLRARGSLPDGVVLGPTNALAYRVHVSAEPRIDQRTQALALSALVALSAIVMIVRNRRV